MPEGVGPGEEFEVARLTVVCPDGVGPGELIVVPTAEGEVEVEVPAGVGPGDAFAVTVG